MPNLHKQKTASGKNAKNCKQNTRISLTNQRSTNKFQTNCKQNHA